MKMKEDLVLIEAFSLIQIEVRLNGMLLISIAFIN